MIDFYISNLALKLELPPGVFQPNTTTQLLAEHMINLKGKTVLDLGCGAAPIAVLAALRGAKKVYAVDIMDEACSAAEKNAELNGVSDKVVVLRGNLFQPLEGLTFDVIVDDVSGMADTVSRLSPWYPKEIPTGGPDGTTPTVQMLRESPAHLNENGYLLFPVLSLARSQLILAVAQEVYSEKLHQVTSKVIPFCKELEKNIELLMRLKDEGMIHFIQKRSRYLWTLDIYRASR